MNSKISKDMKHLELIRFGLIMVLISSVLILMSSCSVTRETKKRVWDVEFKSPIKVTKVEKCN
jgi:hypothetical protein